MHLFILDSTISLDSSNAKLFALLFKYEVADMKDK